MKKKIKRIFFSENGSVSVFAIMIILPIFLLNALLIDTLRIVTAERQIESAMESALRSTMSQFSSDLAAVGLFAYGGDDAGSNFNSYMMKQINDVDLSNFRNLSNPNITSATASFDNTRNLVDFDVFRHQVLESMKYQAPVQMGSDLFDLLLGHDGVNEEDIDEAEELVENYEEILELMKKRNNKIDKAINQLEPYLKVVKDEIKKDIIGDPVSSDDETIPKGINTFQQLVFYNDRYKKLSEKEDLTDDEKNELEYYEDALNLDIVKKIVDVKIYHEDIPTHLIGKNGTLGNPSDESAKGYNDEINDMMDDSDLLEGLEDFTLKDSFFSEILNKSDEIYEEISLDKELPDDADFTDPASYTIGQLFTLFYSAIEANNKQAAELIIQTIENKITNLKTEQAETIENHMHKYDKLRKELNNVDIQEEEDKAEESFGDLWAKLNKYNDIKDQIAGDNQIYAELDSIIAEYNGVTGETGDTDEPSRLQFIEDAFDRFKEFVNFMQGFPKSVRDELYINEYILANYGTEPTYELGNPESYAYSTKQAQYITYGYNVAGMNYFMFLKDIVLIMFVANLISQGIQGGFAGPLGFFKAISGALLSTLDNLTKLTSDPYSFQWSPFKAFGGKGVNMTMPMFLRIIMAMKSTGESYNNEKMRRLQAVVTKETGVNLNSRPSYIEGNVEGEIKLWFIPQLAEVLPGDVEGNTYHFNKRKVYSY